MAKAKAKPKAKPKAKAKAKPAAKKATATKPTAAATVALSEDDLEEVRAPAVGIPAAGPVLRGLRSVIFQVDDLARAKTFYSAAIGHGPYFDEPFYVGYHVEGFELGLDPDLTRHLPGQGGATAYWRVDDIVASHGFLVAMGGRSIAAPHNVGGPIEVAVVADPFGNTIGLIQGT